MKNKTAAIPQETVILDIISRYRETEAVFKKLEEETAPDLLPGPVPYDRGSGSPVRLQPDRALDDIHGLIRTT
jgi:hypothetical protein